MKGNKRYGYEQQQTKIQATAYEKQVTHDMFEMTMKWLEKYIEIAYDKEFPDWENRKQFRDNSIERQDIIGNPEIAEETFSTQLYLFESTAKTKSPAILEELKQEFYRWVSAVKINSDECPERLKFFLFGLNEILEGKGGKIHKDIENRKKIVDSSSPEYMKGLMNLFADVQGPAQREIEVEKSLRGKTDKNIKVKSNFSGGDVEQGQEAFGRIAGTVASNYENFHCVPQKDQGGGYYQISGYLTINGAVINNEHYDEIPANSVQATPEQVDEVNRSVQNNSNEMKWIPVGIAGSGLVALVVSGIVRVFRPSLR